MARPKLPDLTHCSGCEHELREGDEMFLIVDCKLKGGELKYRAIDAFHQACYPTKPVEIPDGEAPEPLPPQ